MNIVKNIGLIIFLVAFGIFSALPFFGSFQLTEEIMYETLSEHELKQLEGPFRDKIVGKEYNTSFAMGRDIMAIYDEINDKHIANQEWDQKLGTESYKFAFTVAKASSKGFVTENKWLLFLLTFVLGSFGAILRFLQNIKLLGPPGIKNDGIYHSKSQNRGWIGILIAAWLISFYVFLYFHPYIMVNLTNIVDPIKDILVSGTTASVWFLYAFMYCVIMTVMAVRMYIKYRHSKYQIARTTSVLFFQLIFAFLIAEILPAFDLPGVDFKNAWPLDYDFLFDYNVQSLLSSGNFGKFIFIWSILLALVLVPLFSYFYGKRWYCSWVCGCGGLAETAGDPFRQLSNKKMWSWKLERWLVHGVLVFAVIMTVFTGYHTYNIYHNPEMDQQHILLGFSAYDVRHWYSFLIGSLFAGVIGTGFYPILGNRAWCRFGCPLAAYLGIVQRFKSRFRITTNGGQCISCGNCSTYCEQGIDVRAYAQKGQNIVRASCVGCGVCSAVCPRGVLKLENGPEKNRFGNEGPIVLGNDGFELNA